MLIDPRFSTAADKFFALTKDQPYGGASLAVYQDGAPAKIENEIAFLKSDD